MSRSLTLILSAGLLFALASPSPILPTPLAAQQNRNEPPPPDPALQKMQKAADKERNQQRQSELKRDADELYKLATELKNSVDKTNENVLSLDVIKKAEEIEKLAHSVRTKMKAEGYGSTVQ